MGRNGIRVGFLAASSVLALSCGQTSSNGDAHGGAPGSAGSTTAAAGHSAGGGDRADPPSSGGSAGSVDEGGSGGGILVGGTGADDSSNGGSTNAGSTNGGSTNGGSTNAISDVKPSPGCGQPAPQAGGGDLVMYTLHTEGVKDPNCADKLENGTPVCGPWSLEREYYLGLPPNYDPSKPYPLVIQAPGCSSDGKSVYPLTGVSDTVIRVGLTPPPISIGHGTNPGQHCFDDKEGDDSVDFVFYEKLLDTLKSALCYDENRVYVSGDSSGAWLANELACKYAGDTQGHAVRALAVNEGGLPNQAEFAPTCSGKPVAGMWIYQITDVGASYPGNKYAIARAMKTNSCASLDFDDARVKGKLINFPIGGGRADDTCSLIKECDPLYPLVVCQLPMFAQAGSQAVVNPAFATFFKTLAAR